MIVGFNGKKTSIIEIFCVILILVVLIIMAISGISSLLGSDGENSWKQRENNIISKAEEYFLKNYKDDLVLGENIDIQLQALKEKGYLKEDLSNECINKSYVSVYKDVNGNYIYVPVINCFNYNYRNNQKYPSVDASLNDNTLLISIKENSNNQKILLYDCKIKVYQEDEEIFNIDLDNINSKDYNKSIDLSKYNTNLDKLKIIISVKNTIGLYTDVCIKK